MKKLIVVFISVIMLLSVSACNHEKPCILFNKQPITLETVLDNSSVFKPGVRIYYLIAIPKPVKTKEIFIQIIKKDNDEERLGYQLYWSKYAKLKDEQMYYYDDYVVIHQKGAYVMQVYAKDNPTKRLAMAPFYVRN